MSIETVIQIAKQLQAEGKQPSVALVKARLPAPCPMPDVISGLQRWRQQSSPAGVSGWRASSRQSRSAAPPTAKRYASISGRRATAA